MPDGSDSCESEIEHTILNNSTFINNLNNRGFGQFADPDTGEVIAKMHDGKLVVVEKAE